MLGHRSESMILSLTNGQEVNLHATWLLNKFAAFTKLKGFWEKLGWLPKHWLHCLRIWMFRFKLIELDGWMDLIR